MDIFRRGKSPLPPHEDSIASSSPAAANTLTTPPIEGTVGARPRSKTMSSISKLHVRGGSSAKFVILDILNLLSNACLKETGISSISSTAN